MTQALLIEQLDHDILRVIIFEKDETGNKSVKDIYESSSHPWIRQQLKRQFPECLSVWSPEMRDFAKVWDQSKVFQTAMNLRRDLRTKKED